MFEKILIANRGEIALRVLRTCREMGIQSVMVHSVADSNAMYLRLAEESVCIGDSPVTQSYLNAVAIISAAELTGADAIHPGYGLLSENAEFAEQVENSGFVFIGPPAEIIRLMGDKIEAKIAAKKYGLKTIPGSEGALPEDVDEALALIRTIGYPVVIKAAAGGGGRGMRVVYNEGQARNVLPVLAMEAKNAFKDGTLYAERFLANPRHIEVQVLADGERAVHLGTRDCSLQRRHQKIIEEAPAPNVAPKKLEAVCNACVTASKKMGYRGAGTFEFLYEDGQFYFIEMNTRLQVEHPVSELITGIDIVAEQIKVAAGRKLKLNQKEIKFNGHAIECRVNAEDPETFLPSPGMIEFYHPPGGQGVRIDSHIYSGYEIPPFYDSLIAKLVAYAPDRARAIERASGAIAEFVIDGVATNLPLHQKLLRDDVFLAGNMSVNYLENKKNNG